MIVEVKIWLTRLNGKSIGFTKSIGLRNLQGQSLFVQKMGCCKMVYCKIYSQIEGRKNILVPKLDSLMKILIYTSAPKPNMVLLLDNFFLVLLTNM
jgi:hypothetical protein